MGKGHFSFDHLIADKGYDKDALVQEVADSGAIAVIPPRSNRKQPRDYDHYLYRERRLIECFINKIKYFRHLKTTDPLIGSL
ncbi:MAG: transposase [Acidobacteriota bacterium]